MTPELCASVNFSLRQHTQYNSKNQVSTVVHWASPRTHSSE